MVFLYPNCGTASDGTATVMPAETDFPCHRSNAMNGKTAFVLLSGVLSGSLCACAQPPEAAAPAASPPPPEAAAPAVPPPPVAAPPPAPAPKPSNRWVSIQGRRAKGCWSYHQTIGLRQRCSISAIRQRASAAEPSMWPRSPNAEEWAESYCAEHPGRSAVEAFRQAYRQTFRR